MHPAAQRRVASEVQIHGARARWLLLELFVRDHALITTQLLGKGFVARGRQAHHLDARRALLMLRSLQAKRSAVRRLARRARNEQLLRAKEVVVLQEIRAKERGDDQR